MNNRDLLHTQAKLGRKVLALCFSLGMNSGTDISVVDHTLNFISSFVGGAEYIAGGPDLEQSIIKFLIHGWEWVTLKPGDVFLKGDQFYCCSTETWLGVCPNWVATKKKIGGLAARRKFLGVGRLEKKYIETESVDLAERFKIKRNVEYSA